MSIITEHTNLDKFWLVEDGLHLTNNLYFGIGKSYYCGHGCQVCYIRDELKAMKGKTQPIYNNDLQAMQESWDDLYTFFNSVALDEDPYYMKFNHAAEYQWYIENAYKCSYGTTDNGIFRMNKIKNIKFKSMAEVALSISFIEKIGHKKIIAALEGLMPIEKIKFLIDKKGDYPVVIVDWIKRNNIPVVVHKMDFATSIETEFDTLGFEQVQEVNWIEGRTGAELVKVHINSDVIIYYDSFYFSNNIGDDPYCKLDRDKFDYKTFLASMLEGKQKTYVTYSELVEESPLKQYFLNTQKYRVNYSYNFIPNFMIDYKIRFFNRMVELGWNTTKYGLVQGNPDKIIPIIEKVMI